MRCLKKREVTCRRINTMLLMRIESFLYSKLRNAPAEAFTSIILIDFNLPHAILRLEDATYTFYCKLFFLFLELDNIAET